MTKARALSIIATQERAIRKARSEQDRMVALLRAGDEHGYTLGSWDEIGDALGLPGRGKSAQWRYRAYAWFRNDDGSIEERRSDGVVGE